MILLIGGSSFIGVHTVEELIKQGCDVVVTGRNDNFKEHYEQLGVKYIKLDLTNKNDFNKLPTEGVEGVILLAGLLPANAPVNLDENENAAEYFEINTLGTVNVLEYCRKNGINRVISTTSYAEVYNSWNRERPLTEDEPRGFQYSGDHAVYVISKNAAADVMEYYNQQHGMKNAIFRLPPVYGVGPHGTIYVNGEPKKSGLQIFIENARAGKDITIFGDKNVSRDVIYVKDVARAFYLAISSNNTSGLYNMTSGIAISLDEQAKIITRVFAPNENTVSKIKYKPEVKNNTRSYIFSMEKAKKDFEFVPKYSNFKTMMIDYKKDIDKEKYKKLFNY